MTKNNSPKTIVFVPGCPGNQKSFDNLSKNLSIDHDLQMHFADHITGNDLDEIANQILSDTKGQLIVVGHSLGGVVAQTMAILQPERIEAMCLIGSTARADTEEEKTVRKVQLDELERLDNDLTALFSPFIPHMVHHSRRTPNLEQKLLGLLGTFPSDIFRNQFNALIKRKDQKGELQHFLKPVLVLCGEDDVIFPLDHSRELAEILQNAELVTLEECGHLPTFEYPEHTTAIVMDWLQRLNLS